MDQSPGGDGGNKKRAAARQLSKDDDPDAEEDDHPGGVGGTFQRASDAVLATRRMVKVKRTASTAIGPNPFAGISLAAPAAPATFAAGTSPPAPSASPATAATSTEPEILEESALAPAGAEVAKGVAGEKDGGSESSVEGGAIDVTGAAPEGDDGKETGTEDNGKVEQEADGEVAATVLEVVADKQAENGSNGEPANDTPKPKDAEFSISGAQSFQLASSSTNAFGSFAGSFGLGFSSSSFNVANNSTSTGLSSFSFGSATGFGTGSTGAFPSLSTVFGNSNGASPFQLFGSSANSTLSPSADGSGTFRTVALQEVPVETGEEKERAVFSSDATLFEFLKDGGWKERGKGELKVNVSEDSTRTARLVMRSKGNFRLLLNANLFPDMKLNRMENRGVSFACVNSVTERQDGLVTYAVKMRDSGLVGDFLTAVESYKGRSQNSAQLKTPENSPKASVDHPKPFEGSSAPDADKKGEET